MSTVGAALLLVLCGACPDPDQVGFDGALALVGEGRFAAALEAAEGEPDALRRAQALVHVRHHAGDLHGALRAALSGLDAAPGDPWLLEQAAFVAVSLNEGALAGDLGVRLVDALERGLDAAQGDALGRARALLGEARAAEGRAAERGAALVRARRVALGLLLGAVVLAWALARPSRRAPAAEGP